LNAYPKLLAAAREQPSPPKLRQHGLGSWLTRNDDTNQRRPCGRTSEAEGRYWRAGRPWSRYLSEADRPAIIHDTAAGPSQSNPAGISDERAASGVRAATLLCCWSAVAQSLRSEWQAARLIALRRVYDCSTAIPRILCEVFAFWAGHDRGPLWRALAGSSVKDAGDGEQLPSASRPRPARNEFGNRGDTLRLASRRAWPHWSDGRRASDADTEHELQAKQQCKAQGRERKRRNVLGPGSAAAAIGTRQRHDDGGRSLVIRRGYSWTSPRRAGRDKYRPCTP
jgi:hypothetical protein